MIKKGLRLLAPLAVAALFTPVAHAGDIPPMPQAYPISNLYKSCSAAGDNVEREWRFAETGRRYMSDGTLQFKNTTNQEIPRFNAQPALRWHVPHNRFSHLAPATFHSALTGVR